MKPIPAPTAARTVAALIATASLALLAAACGGSSSTGGSSTTGGSTHSRSANSQALAYSRCVRSRGVPNYPDPGSGGEPPNVTAQQVGVSAAKLQTAITACQHLLPNGNGPTPAQLQQAWNDDWKFARCMRHHGFPTWPDPTRYPGKPEYPDFNLPAAGIGIGSNTPPHMMTKVALCRRLTGNPQLAPP